MCGSDGKTYENSCELENVSCRKYWDIRVVSMVRMTMMVIMMTTMVMIIMMTTTYNLGINLSTGSLSVNVPWSYYGNVHWVRTLPSQQ